MKFTRASLLSAVERTVYVKVRYCRLKTGLPILANAIMIIHEVAMGAVKSLTEKIANEKRKQPGVCDASPTREKFPVGLDVFTGMSTACSTVSLS